MLVRKDKAVDAAAETAVSSAHTLFSLSLLSKMASQTTTQKEKEEVKVRHGPDSRLSPTSTAFMRLNHDNMSSSHRLRTASVHHKTPTVQEQDHDEDAPLHILMTTYLGYGILILFGHLRDFFGKIFKKQEYAAYQEHDVMTLFKSFSLERLLDADVIKKKGICAVDFWV